MLTKAGNLASLQNLKQSQLNLGVIQSLVGEVFNTDNCTVVENSAGTSFRHPSGLQLCMTAIRTIATGVQPGGSGSTTLFFPQPFSGAGSYLVLLQGYSSTGSDDVAQKITAGTPGNANSASGCRITGTNGTNFVATIACRAFVIGIF
ncbi:hypothetical protein [Paenalcaligenes suwonensis]|uniref:hypothetical protein n=1 Tax=Paenalcaligenes suwonensis TaxID=1202713 RepID=UPI00140E510D|nr:hypothetical protein [Paenalcaligenes suwonensis]NHC63271.1 hypothetical protein [Paenalcaligenes suwonensis]